VANGQVAWGLYGDDMGIYGDDMGIHGKWYQKEIMNGV